MELDEMLSKLGTWNRWRIVIYCMVCCSVTVPGCWQIMSITFIGGEMEHHCKVPENRTLNDTIPYLPVKTEFGEDTGEYEWSKCTRYFNSTVRNVTSCDEGWEYDTSEFKSTIVSDWDLVCANDYLVETSQSVFSFGVIIGDVVFTSLADKYGRKIVHLSCQYAGLVVAFAIIFSPNYITFVVLRFVIGAFREGAGLVGVVMACELFPARLRTFAGTAFQIFWSAAWMLMALIAYLIRDWRYLQLAFTLPAVLTISLIC